MRTDIVTWYCLCAWNCIDCSLKWVLHSTDLLMSHMTLLAPYASDIKMAVRCQLSCQPLTFFLDYSCFFLLWFFLTLFFTIKVCFQLLLLVPATLVFIFPTLSWPTPNTLPALPDIFFCPLSIAVCLPGSTPPIRMIVDTFQPCLLLLGSHPHTAAEVCKCLCSHTCVCEGVSLFLNAETQEILLPDSFGFNAGLFSGIDYLETL